MIDLVEIAARHRPWCGNDQHVHPRDDMRCAECDQPWGENGCHAAQLAQALATAAAEAERLRAREKVLAEALRDAISAIDVAQAHVPPTMSRLSTKPFRAALDGDRS